MDKRFDNLPTLMKDAIRVLQRLHNTPDALAMPAVLGMANLAAMPHYRVDTIKFKYKPISLYIMCMLPTGMRKSTNYNEVIPGIRRFEERKYDALAQEPTRFALQTKAYKKAEDKYIKDMEQNGDYATTPVPAPVKPIETCEYLLDKGTVNGIIDQLVTQPFVGFFSDEAGDFFSGHAFQGGRDARGRSTEMTSTLTKLWDGSHITRQTGLDSTRLYNRAANMMFFLQEEMARDFLNNPIFSAQGFVHRVLITQSGTVPKQPMDLSDEAIEQEEQIRTGLIPFHDRIEQIIGRPLRLREDRNFELDPEIVRLTPRARTLFQHFYNQWLFSSDNELRNYAGFAERLYEHALRIAATLAVFELQTEIEAEHAVAAWDLMDFFIEQRRNLELGITSRNQAQQLGVERLAAWMQERKFAGTRSDIGRSVRWFKNLTEAEKTQLLEDLVSSEQADLTVTESANHRQVATYTWRGK